MRLHNELDLNAYWVPFTANRAYKAAPRLLQSAAGMHYRTVDGREVLDGMSGLWCCNAGHCHPAIVRAIAEQAAEMDYATAFGLAHPAAFQLASRLAALAPGELDTVFFANSGSEAVDTALKIALAYHHARGESSRTRLVGRERGYHGVGFGGTSVGGIGNNRKQFGPLLPGVLHLPQTYSFEHHAFTRGQPDWGGHLADELERLIAVHHASTIAAVIVEPFAGSAGVLPPPVGYLERLREITSAHGILLVFDEVIAAFGRVGTAFAAERFGVVPDIVTVAKGITSGTVPMGAVLVRGGRSRRHRRRRAGRHRVLPRLHLLRASAGLRGGDGDAGRLRIRRAVRPFPGTRTGARIRCPRFGGPAPCAGHPQHRPRGRSGARTPGRCARRSWRGRLRARLRPRRAAARHRRHRRHRPGPDRLGGEHPRGCRCTRRGACGTGLNRKRARVVAMPHANAHGLRV